MSVDSRTQTIDATGRLPLANANFLFLIAATAAVTITFSRGGSTETFQNTLAGLSVARVQKWDYAFITGAAGTVVTFFYGITAIREDDTQLLQSLATIAGNVSTTDLPSATMADTADTAQAAGTQTAIAANLARRRIKIGVPSSALNSVRVSFSGGAARGVEIQPGQNEPFYTTAALIVRNDDTFATGAATSWYAEEEA